MNTYMHASICTGEQRHRALRGCAAAGGVKGVRQASAAMERGWYAFRLLLCCFACAGCCLHVISMACLARSSDDER